MKFNKILITTLATSLLSLSALGHAKVLGQAGNIEIGEPYVITKSDFASYYKDGKSGSVIFFCTLEGNNAKALVFPGKNFQENLPAVLKNGDIGMYNWTLKDKGETTGNIKVRLLWGDKATVTCKELG